MKKLLLIALLFIGVNLSAQDLKFTGKYIQTDSTKPGTVTIKAIANNTWGFYLDAIGEFLEVGPGNTVNVKGQQLIANSTYQNNLGSILTSGIQQTSGAGAGKVYTSDASGNGTWQPNAGAITGTYTPTVGIIANVNATGIVPVAGGIYTVNGKVVTLQIQLQCNVTTANTLARVTVTLPTGYTTTSITSPASVTTNDAGTLPIGATSAGIANFVTGGKIEIDWKPTVNANTMQRTALLYSLPVTTLFLIHTLLFTRTLSPAKYLSPSLQVQTTRQLMALSKA